MPACHWLQVPVRVPLCVADVHSEQSGLLPDGRGADSGGAAERTQQQEDEEEEERYAASYKPAPFDLSTDRCCLVHSTVRPLSKEITMSQAYQNMCAGMYKVQRQEGEGGRGVAPYVTRTEKRAAPLCICRPWWPWTWMGRCTSLTLSWTVSRFATSIDLLPSTAWSPPHPCITSSSRYWSSACLSVRGGLPPDCPSCSSTNLTLSPLQEMSDLKKYNPPPGSADLYLAASKHFQQAKLILENVPSPDPEVIFVGFLSTQSDEEMACASYMCTPRAPVRAQT